MQATLHNGVRNISTSDRKWTFLILKQWFGPNPVANRVYKSKDAEKYKCDSVKAV